MRMGPTEAPQITVQSDCLVDDIRVCQRVGGVRGPEAYLVVDSDGDDLLVLFFYDSKFVLLKYCGGGGELALAIREGGPRFKSRPG